MDSSERKITTEGFNNCSAKMLPVGTVLFTSRAGIGKTAILAKKGCTNQGFQSIVPHEKELDSYFIFSRTEELKRYGEVAGAGSTFVEVSGKQMANMDIMIPSIIDEQKQIGSYFKMIDILITLHQRKYRNLQKKSLCAWEQRKLGDLVDRVTRKNQDLVSELPLTISAQYGLIDQNEFFDKRVASKDVSGYYLIENGEFAYNKSTSTDAPWGAIKRLERYENGVLSTLYIVFRIKDDASIDSDFLVSYYSTNLWHKGIHEIAAEGARNHGLLNIAPTDFFDTKLAIPQDVEEQCRIGQCFTKLEALITLHQRKLKILKNIKKSMLEKIFV